VTQYLAIITAYGAVGLLAWLAALLYPRLIPAAAEYRASNRWRQIVLFAAATAISVVLASLADSGLFLAESNPLQAALNQCAIFAPVIGYIFFCRSRTLVMIPGRNTIRSLAVGVGIAFCALAAFYSAADQWENLPRLGNALFSLAAVEIAVRAVFRCLVIAAFLSLVSSGWSKGLALGLAGLAVALTQIPGLLEDGFSAAWFGLLAAHVALVVGLLSAILATRNIVWFWFVFTALNLLLFSLP